MVAMFGVVVKCSNGDVDNDYGIEQVGACHGDDGIGFDDDNDYNYDSDDDHDSDVDRLMVKICDYDCDAYNDGFSDIDDGIHITDDDGNGCC